MSGTDAAATLSLKIDTHGAKADLEALKKEYISLHAAMRDGLPNLGGTAAPVQQVKASLTAYVNEFKAAGQQISGMKFTFPALTAGNGDVLAGYRGKIKQEFEIVRAELASQVKKLGADLALANAQITSLMAAGTGQSTKTLGVRLGAGAGSVGATVGLDKDQIKTLNDKLKAVGLEAAKALDSGFTTSNFSKTNQVIAAFSKNTEASLQSVIRMAQDAKRLADTVGPETAGITYGPLITSGNAEAEARSRLAKIGTANSTLAQWKDEEATAKMELAEIRRVQGIKDYVNQVILASAIAEKTRREEVQKAWDARKARRSLASAESTIAQWKDEEATAKMELAAAKRVADIKEREVLEVARWARLDAKERALATLRAARAIYTGADQSALPGVEGSSQARNAALSATSIASAQAAYDNLSKTRTEQQIHWNKIANEGHAAARGLAGSLGTLWITYGQLAPLLAGAAIGSSFIQAAKAGSEFAYQLTFVKALSQETSASLKLLGDSTLNLSRQSLQGPNDIASGYRILAQAGLDVTSSISAMPHVLHLATVGEMEMEQSAVTLIGVLNAFGLSIGNVEHVGNVFAKAAALSQTSVQSMTEAMKTASVVGEQYGASLEDTATAITLLAKVNITGTSAGTAYRNMLKELYAPVPAAAEAFKRLGVSTQDAAGNIRPFGDVIFDLKEKLEGFNKGDQIKILQRLFGERGAKEAVAMLSLTKDKWIELRDAINNSDGFMSGVAKELEDTAKGRWAQAVNTMKSSLIEAFSAMEPAFKSLADSFKALFSDETFITGLKRIVEGMLGLTKALVEAAPAVITLAEAYLVLKTAMIGATVWTAASTAMSGYTAALWAASGAMGPVAKGVTVANTALSFLPAGFAASMSPMGLVVGGLAAAGLAFYLFRDRTAEAMEASTEKVRGFAREAKVLLDEVAMTLHNSSVAMSQSRLSAAQTAVVASNETVDESAKAYLKKYGKGNIAGTAAAVESAEAYVRSATTVNSTGETYTTEDAQYKAAVALTQANAATRALQKKFYETQDQVRQKEEAEANLAAIKASQRPAVAKGNIDDILGKDAKTKAGGSNRGELKDARTLLSDNLSSGLKQEQIQLGREVIEIETQLAAQTVSATVAQEKKNEATLASLSIERMWIEQSVADAKALGDKVQLSKFENDLSENSLKIEKQTQQANLDSVKARTADNNSIEDSILASQRYVEGLQFEVSLLGKTAEETARLRAERQAALALDDIAIKEKRNQIAPEVANQERAAIVSNRDALIADTEFRESWLGGWSEAFDAHNKRATSAAQSAKDSFAAMASSMEDALVTFVTTGKLNFASFAKALIADIARIEARALMSKVLSGGGGSSGLIKGAIGLVSGLFGGGGTVGGTLPGVMTNGVAIMGGTSSANGNVFSGSPSLHAYANTVQTSPKTFAYQNLHAFAKGGVFAEAGPEAVMPLTRDSRGRLGVRSQGGGDGRITIINQTTGRIDRVSEKTLSSGERALIIEEAVATTAAQFADPNSKTSRSMHRTFNLQRNR